MEQDNLQPENLRSIKYVLNNLTEDIEALLGYLVMYDRLNTPVLVLKRVALFFTFLNGSAVFNTNQLSYRLTKMDGLEFVIAIETVFFSNRNILVSEQNFSKETCNKHLASAVRNYIYPKFKDTEIERIEEAAREALYIKTSSADEKSDDAKLNDENDSIFNDDIIFD